MTGVEPAVVRASTFLAPADGDHVSAPQRDWIQTPGKRFTGIYL
jgi:hypothetical protein